MARIGIDARFWSQSGIGRYIRNLILNLQLLDPENNYFIFLLKKDFDEFKVTKNFNKVLANFGWYGLSEQIKFPPLLYKYNLDLVHFPHFNVPIFYSGKYIVTVHDLIHQNFKMKRTTTLNPLVYGIKQFGYNKIFKNSVFGSQKILVPSDFVKEQLILKWNVNPQKIEVTYEGVDEKILSLKNKISKIRSLEIIRNIKVTPPYIFYVGNAHPHKNVEGLIKAFVRVKGQGSLLRQDFGEQARVKELKLVLAGHDHYFWKRLKREFINKDLVFVGSVTDEELVSLYKNAEVFVMPSFEEGFGIPLLEAMACGVPIVSSNGGSLPEIGGKACIYFDPSPFHHLFEPEPQSRRPERSSEGPQDLAEKILEVLKNQKLRKELVEKGEKRYKQFSWENLAKDTLNIYREVI